jgi:hypothetical protein
MNDDFLMMHEQTARPFVFYYAFPLKKGPECGKLTLMESFDAHVYRNTKDSIFCDLFSRPEYCLQLYQALHPEDTDVREENIVLVTLSRLMMRSRYNDLGFLVKDRLLILVECQSTFTENILVRFILYLADTYNRYINKMNLNIYGSKKVRLPIPELYVIYHGERGNKPDEIFLSKDIFGVNSADNVFVDVKARIIYDSTPGDIINQFITFARVFDKQIQTYDRTRLAVEETLRICKDQDVLRAYLEEEEAAEIMFTWLDEQKAKKFEEEEIRQEGRAEGEFDTLVCLVRKNLLSVKNAAEQAGMTEIAFCRKAGLERRDDPFRSAERRQ